MANETEKKDEEKKPDPNILFEVTAEVIKKAKAERQGEKLDIIEIELDDERMFYCITLRPNNASISRYVNKLAQAGRDKKDTGPIHSRFVYDNLVAPTKEKFMELTDELPLLPISVADQLGQGQGMASSSKKKSL